MDLSTLSSEGPAHYDDSMTGMQNHVGTVMLKNVPIVSLLIDGKERLCLAQISNTLLRDFTYNEIHNRRVALGITCIQCTPVQLEILRRAGAMPVSSRRCGMITKREAQRLVKSFLEEATPPQLPENFSFDVYHECGWGCQGKFVPSRYNSSRAKCIKCVFCNIFFSPNKFIFHCHKLTTSTYHHPDAANFNSWRRHLKLLTPSPDEELVFAWEDVKAMFNGGSRRKVMDHPNTSRDEPESKIPKLEPVFSSDSGYYPSYPNNNVVSNPYDVYRQFPIRPVVSPLLGPEMDWSKYTDLLRMRAMSGQYPYFWPRETPQRGMTPMTKLSLPVKKNTPFWRGFLDEEPNSPKLKEIIETETEVKVGEKCSRKSKPRKCDVSLNSEKILEDEDNELVVTETDINGQKTDNNGQKTVVNGQKTDIIGQKTDDSVTNPVKNDV